MKRLAFAAVSSILFFATSAFTLTIDEFDDDGSKPATVGNSMIPAYSTVDSPSPHYS